MFYSKDHKQKSLVDPWEYLGPKRRKMLDRSWAGLFRRKILAKLPVDDLRGYYHDSDGRPTKEMSSMIGLMILQQMHDLNDEAALEQFCYNVQWRYALNITDESDKSSYVSARTLWSMRWRLTQMGLDVVLFESTARLLADVFKVDLSQQRIDSVHIHSNMRRLGRIGLFVATIKKFLSNLKRHYADLFEALDEELKARYHKKPEEAVFGQVKPSGSRVALDQAAKDLYLLVERFGSIPDVAGMGTFKLLVRLFQEQCCVEDRGGDPVAVARPNEEVPSNSMQNPSDPDAGYCGHKGQGYQIQVMETYRRESSNDSSNDSFNLITHVAVEPAHCSDANALLPAIENAKDSHMAPEELLADSVYGGDDNCQQADSDYGVEVISPVMGTTGEGLTLDDFTIDDSGKVTACPEGRSPVRVRFKKRFSAAFNKDNCLRCPQRKRCPVKPAKKAAYLRYSKAQARLARRRIYERTPEFRDKYRFRAGVEATMSEFDRRTGVKRLRVRGLEQVSYSAFMKAVGLNIRRAAASEMWLKTAQVALFGLFNPIFLLLVHLAERIGRVRSRYAKFTRRVSQDRNPSELHLKIAA